MKVLSEIKKTYYYNYEGYLITINRTFRGENFLEWIENKNVEYLSKIIPHRTVFLTLRGAKQYAIELINEDLKN